MTYGDLGGSGVPPVYAEWIGNPCPSCPAKMGDLCTDSDGKVRKRPHIRRAIIQTGASSDTAGAETS